VSLVNINEIHKYFDDLHVLKGVTLEVQEGEVVTIIGRSGSGKSTLLRTINGLEGIDGGTIHVDGHELVSSTKSLRELRLKVGMVFQQFNLFPHLKAGQNVMLALKVVKGIDEAEAREMALKAMEKVGLLEKFDVYPDQLSGGQQQRVAIARALAMSPKVLLCDEITSALDPELVNEVLTVVRQLADEGITLIIVTHEMRFARDVSDKVIFMHHGRVPESGDPKDLFNNPQTPELSAFIQSIA
jgi:polar amino acid transport system ATP-binding protein